MEASDHSIQHLLEWKNQNQVAEYAPVYIGLDTLTRNFARDVYEKWTDLLQRCSTTVDDVQRKRMLLDYLLQTRRALLKLLVLSRWAEQGGAERVQTMEALTLYLSHGDRGLQQLADKLFFFHGTLEGIKMPLFDVEIAADVLSTGLYQRLPGALDAVRALDKLTDQDQVTYAMAMNRELALQLNTLSLSAELKSYLRMDIGQLVMHVPHEFLLHLTLAVNAEGKWLWNVRRLKVLLRRLGQIHIPPGLILRLTTALNNSMALPDVLNPLQLCYDRLHSVVLQMAVEELHVQAMELAGVYAGRLQVKQDQAEGKLEVSCWSEENTFEVRVLGGKLVALMKSKEDMEASSDFKIELALDQLDFEPVFRTFLRHFCAKRLRQLYSAVVFDGQYTATFDEDAEIMPWDVKVNAKDDDEQPCMIIRLGAGSTGVEPVFVLVVIEAKTGRYLLSVDEYQSRTGSVFTAALEVAQKQIQGSLEGAKSVFVKLKNQVVLEQVAAACAYFGLTDCDAIELDEGAQLEMSQLSLQRSIHCRSLDRLLFEIKDDFVTVSILKLRILVGRASVTATIVEKRIETSITLGLFISDLQSVVSNVAASFRRSIIQQTLLTQFAIYKITPWMDSTPSGIRLISSPNQLPPDVRLAPLNGPWTIRCEVTPFGHKQVECRFPVQDRTLVLCRPSYDDAIHFFMGQAYMLSNMSKLFSSYTQWSKQCSESTRVNLQFVRAGPSTFEISLFQKFTAVFEWHPSLMFRKNPTAIDYREGTWSVTLSPDSPVHPLFLLKPYIAEIISTADCFKSIYRRTPLLGFLTQIAAAANKPGKWTPQEGETSDAFIIDCKSFDHWRLTYRHHHAVDIHLVRNDYFVLTDVSHMEPDRFKALPNMQSVLAALCSEIPALLDRMQAARLKDGTGVLAKVDTFASLVPVSNTDVVGNVGADAWILREVISRLFKAIHSANI